MDPPPPTATATTRKARDLAALPKAELHLHLEGAMRPATLRDLCRKHSVPFPAIPCWDATVDPPRPRTEVEPFDDFSAFLDVYAAACECLRTREDARRLVLEVAEDLKNCGAIYAEVALSHTFYARRFGSAEATLEVLAEAASEAEARTGVAMSYVLGAERHLGFEAAVEMARLARTGAERAIHGRPAVARFGLHGPEEGHPPGPFEDAFRVACGDGKLASLPHAGEIAPSPGAGAESVRDAVRTLGAKRIAHGILADGDEGTLRLLRERNVVLDVGVTSNFLLKVVPSLEDHPVKRFIGRGIKCTINSDDPLLFGTDVLSEYELCREVLGMDDDLLAECAKTAFQYSCAPESLKRRGVEGVDRWLSGGRE